MALSGHPPHSLHSPQVVWFIDTVGRAQGTALRPGGAELRVRSLEMTMWPEDCTHPPSVHCQRSICILSSVYFTYGFMSFKKIQTERGC